MIEPQSQNSNSVTENAALNNPGGLARITTQVQGCRRGDDSVTFHWNNLNSPLKNPHCHLPLEDCKMIILTLALFFSLNQAPITIDYNLGSFTQHSVQSKPNITIPLSKPAAW